MAELGGFDLRVVAVDPHAPDFPRQVAYCREIDASLIITELLPDEFGRSFGQLDDFVADRLVFVPPATRLNQSMAGSSVRPGRRSVVVVDSCERLRDRRMNVFRHLGSDVVEVFDLTGTIRSLEERACELARSHATWIVATFSPQTAALVAEIARSENADPISAMALSPLRRSLFSLEMSGAQAIDAASNRVRPQVEPILRIIREEQRRGTPQSSRTDTVRWTPQEAWAFVERALDRGAHRESSSISRFYRLSAHVPIEMGNWKPRRGYWGQHSDHVWLGPVENRRNLAAEVFALQNDATAISPTCSSAVLETWADLLLGHELNDATLAAFEVGLEVDASWVDRCENLVRNVEARSPDYRCGPAHIAVALAHARPDREKPVGGSSRLEELHATLMGADDLPSDLLRAHVIVCLHTGEMAKAVEASRVLVRSRDAGTGVVAAIVESTQVRLRCEHLRPQRRGAFDALFGALEAMLINEVSAGRDTALTWRMLVETRALLRQPDAVFATVKTALELQRAEVGLRSLAARQLFWVGLLSEARLLVEQEDLDLLASGGIHAMAMTSGVAALVGHFDLASDLYSRLFATDPAYLEHNPGYLLFYGIQCVAAGLPEHAARFAEAYWRHAPHDRDYAWMLHELVRPGVESHPEILPPSERGAVSRRGDAV